MISKPAFESVEAAFCLFEGTLMLSGVPPQTIPVNPVAMSLLVDAPSLDLEDEEPERCEKEKV
jgi:hypothetical protein